MGIDLSLAAYQADLARYSREIEELEAAGLPPNHPLILMWQRRRGIVLRLITRLEAAGIGEPVAAEEPKEETGEHG